MPAKAKGRFVDPMLLLRTDSLPNDGDPTFAIVATAADIGMGRFTGGAFSRAAIAGVIDRC